MDSPAAERMRGDERRLTLDEQRASERARYADITARKVESRRELREAGLGPQIATSLAAFRAAQERVDLRDANERAALKRELQQRVEREHDMETPDFALRGAGNAEPRFMRDLSDVDARVERNGDVSDRWRDGGEAFRDTSDASVAAGLELARAKWGNEVTIHGSADFEERTLRLAVERGIHVNNPELQGRQRELVVERERMRSQNPERLRERSRNRGIERDGPDIGWRR